MKLDIGCGSRCREGFMGMDISPDVNADVTWDWENFPWPFKDESVDEINATHVLEHTKNLIKFMDECYRILKKGGKMHVVCPYWTAIGSWQDPTHTRAISEMTFVYFNKKQRDEWQLQHYGIKSDFDFKYSFAIEQKWLNKPQQQLEFAMQHYYNVIREVIVDLVKR